MEERKEELKEEIKENGSSKDSSSTRTETERTRDGRGRGDGNGDTGTERETEKVQTEKGNGLSLVEKEKQKAKERNAKRKKEYEKKLAERKKAGIEQGEPVKVPAVKTEEQPAEEKPKKKSRKKKAEVISADDLDNLFVPLFGLIGSRKGMEHWTVTKKEMHTVTEPLAKIIAKNDSLSKIANNTDEIALIVACMALFVPRTMMTVEKVKENKKNGKPETASVGKKLAEDRKSETGIREDVGKPSTNVQGNGALFSTLGQPIV